MSKLTALLRAQAIRKGTLADAQRVLVAARLPASAAFALLERAAAAGELSVEPDGTFMLTGVVPVAAPSAASCVFESTDQPSSKPCWSASSTGNSDRGEAADSSAYTSAAEVTGVRVIAFDIETALRARVEDGGVLTRRIWQLGAVKFGSDLVWTTAGGETFNAYLELPECYGVPAHRKAEYEAAKKPVEQVLAAFLAWVDGVDLVVAYNGETVDFPALAEGLAAADLPPMPGRAVDGLYLAHCIWPAAPTHQLAKLADHVGAGRGGRWHDALGDSRTLQRLLTRGATQLASADANLQALLRALCHDSDAWRLIGALAPALAGAPQQQGAQRIGELLHDLLAGQDLRRGHVPDSLVVPAELLEHGRVTPAALARALHGPHTEARPSQQQVAAAITAAATAAVPAIIEAPTGTGKSLSALAAALNWLADDPDRSVIISTHTKQLQSQLARELAELAGGVPGLLDTTDVVKGASNRLSLRGLTYTLADASGADVSTAAALIRYTDNVRFRELLAFVLLRLVDTERSKPYRWAAHSVDRADLPAFFTEYCGPVLPAWLASLSQASHGEWRDPARIAVAAYTDEVHEALDNHRLVIANHALLLSHWDALGVRADTTLVIADEAHALEGAATDALSAELSAEDIDDTLGALRQVLWDLRLTGATGAVWTSLADLTRWWRDGRLRRTLSRVLDARVGQAHVGGRTLTIASPHTGAHAARDARTISRILHELTGQVGRVLHELGLLIDATAGQLDFFDEQRLATIRLRVGGLRARAQDIEDTLDGLLPPRPLQPAARPTTGGPAADGDGQPDDDGSDDVAGSVVQLEYAEDAEGTDPTTSVDSAAEDDDADNEQNLELDAAAPAPPTVPQGPDRVVYAAEPGQLDRRGLAHYRIALTSSPIELPKDPTWQALLATFHRLALLSATMTVATPGADPWAYTRARLGLTHANVICLDGPFDYRTQARLVALSDFPSWAEQPKQAMRTVAHQLAGYTREVTRQFEPKVPTGASANADADEPGEEPGNSPWMHGAMVLTTSRNAASGIADELALLHAADGRNVPVHNQVTYGTGRSVADFTGVASHHGGVLVGTRGLWTGVDVSEPNRNHVVWINKLPFPVFTDPVIAARRESVRRSAELAGDDDPDLTANATYYLPLAALDLRQAVGRLIRNRTSRGVIIISDRKLAGDLPLRRLYRQVFLGSLDEGLLVDDPDTGETAGGNVVTMREAWARIWPFLTEIGALPAERVGPLTEPAALEEHTLLPATLAIRRLEMTEQEVARHRAAGTFEHEVLSRCEQVAGLLAGEPRTLKPEQQQAIAAVAAGRDSLALLPTGHGKSFCYQLPALVLPGVTVAISPLISLMHDQALGLNHTIGGAVRALVASLPESVSRAGRTEVVEALSGDTTDGIKLVYVSPERLSQSRFRQALARGATCGALARVAIDEAHTYVQWGDDFRPSFRRAGALLRELRRDHPGVITLQALTATTTPTVEHALREEVLSGLVSGVDGNAIVEPDQLVVVRANPLRPELSLGRRAVRAGNRRSTAAMAEQIIDAEDGHTIIYCLTVRDTDWLHAHLRDYLDGRPVLLRKFHGRLSEVDKASVSLEFKEASHHGDADYVRLIVVATSAFGLGVDRDDVRTVFCASPPTDLAALYQQLGRGGRDVAGTDVSTLTTTTHALAFATNRSLGTAAWMASLDLPFALLQRFGREVLTAAARGYLDTARCVERMLAADVQGRLLTPAQAAQPQLRSSWTVGLTRAVAALADLRAVVDSGDVPAVVALGAGTRLPDTPLAVAVSSAVDALPQRGEPLSRATAPLGRLLHHLHADLSCQKAGLPAAAPGLADLWLLLCDLHDAATLDVSQRPNDRMLAAVSLPANAVPPQGRVELPAQYAARVQGKLGRAITEAGHLQRFFAASRTCLNERLADYFDVTAPDACCSTDRVRCSVCAGAQDGPGTLPGTPLHALVHGTLQPQGVDAAMRAALLDASAEALLKGTFNGLTPRQILLVLTGQDRLYVPRLNSYVNLSQRLRDAAQFGEHPSSTETEVDDSLNRLRAAGRVVDDGRYVREAGNAARGPRRTRSQIGPATVAGRT